MDQGVIRSLEAHYGGRFVRLLCRALEKKEPCQKISILQSMKILVDSWEVVSKEIIINCFRKARITATALVSLDDDVIATAPEISEGDIIEELRACQEPGEGEESDDEISIEEIFDPVVEKPSRSATESALDDLKYVAMFSDEGVQMQRLILSFEWLYENQRLKSLKQRDITDFLKPVEIYVFLKVFSTKSFPSI